MRSSPTMSNWIATKLSCGGKGRRLHAFYPLDERGAGCLNRTEDVFQHRLVLGPTGHVRERALSRVDAEVRADDVGDPFGDTLVLGPVVHTGDVMSQFVGERLGSLALA